MNAIKKLFILSLTFTAAAVYAQVSPSVTGTGFSLWAGGEYSNFAPDYGSNRLNGLGFIIDVNATPRIGAVGEARWLHWSGSGGETQSDYLSGVKYRMFKSGPLSFNAKFLLGGVWITFPGDIGSGSYFALAPGGFVDFHLTHRLLIRGDYEYQFLPSAPDIPGQPSNGLTPNGFSIGVEYNIFGRY
jgi:hypothetical protein